MQQYSKIKQNQCLTKLKKNELTKMNASEINLSIYQAEAYPLAQFVAGGGGVIITFLINYEHVGLSVCYCFVSKVVQRKKNLARTFLQ